MTPQPNAILTGGKAVVPVRVAYERNTSCGLGPNMINMSIMPLSEIQCVSTWGVSSLPLKNDTNDFNMDCKRRNQEGYKENSGHSIGGGLYSNLSHTLNLHSHKNQNCLGNVLQLF